MKIKFFTEHLVISPNIDALLKPSDVVLALQRHLDCDWGDISHRDKNLNDIALMMRKRVRSVYNSESNNTKFWIDTDFTNGITSVMLPDDFMLYYYI